MNNEIDQIIRRYSGGELSGFSDLYAKYGGLIRSVIYKLCPAGDLDDLVQEAFVRIWKGLPKFNRESALKTWIYRIAYNLAVDSLRGRKRAPMQTELKDVMFPSKEEAVMNKDAVREGLNELSGEHREVLVLNIMEGVTIAEISAIMNVPEGTVKSRLFHAKSRMAEILRTKGIPL